MLKQRCLKIEHHEEGAALTATRCPVESGACPSEQESPERKAKPTSPTSFLCLALLVLMSMACVSTFGQLSSKNSTLASTSPDYLASIAEQQIRNFHNGDGLLLNFHVTHHGGTSFCSQISQHLKSPGFACNKPSSEQLVAEEAFPEHRPWAYNETATNIAETTKYFNMISWEFGGPPRAREPQIPETDWENPNLVSVYITRDPLSRLLAGDRYINDSYPNVANKSPETVKATREEWMEFAQDPRGHTNNFALHVLAGNDCCDGSNTDPIHLEHAKQMLDRFTFVLDIECLDQGMQAMADELGMDISIQERKKQPHHRKPAEERIPYPEVVEYLLERNKLDIELHEWAKRRSLVDCSLLQRGD